ncbi:SDR family oxidoreductase [Candidatus Margulisiibacteriota bacterium]
MSGKKETVFISSISSDIGIALAQRYSQDDYIICGSYRSKKLLSELGNLPACHLFFCDLKDKQSIDHMIGEFSQLKLEWETFISCASYPPPLNGFFESDFEKWSDSVHINAIEQCRVLHQLYPYRQKKKESNVVFFAGPGTNCAVKNFSALTVSKLLLIKMCELLNAEKEDLNPFIVGPGWTRTKTHQLIISDPNVSPEKKKETENFLKSNQGTSFDDIYRTVRWLSQKGRKVAGGRNFSVVHDLWGKEELADELLKDPNMYKLRRQRNDWRKKNEQ